jgi:hypothetical protein
MRSAGLVHVLLPSLRSAGDSPTVERCAGQVRDSKESYFLSETLDCLNTASPIAQLTHCGANLCISLTAAQQARL